MCIGDDSQLLFNDYCVEAYTLPYTIVSAVCVFLYCIILVDLAVLSNQLSVYVLLCAQMMREVGTYFVAVGSALWTLSTALSCLHQDIKEFNGIDSASFSFLRMSLYVYRPEDFLRIRGQPVVYCGVLVFTISAMIFFTNMLCAQLIYNYRLIHGDMFGHARMKRDRIVSEIMQRVSQARFQKLVNTLGFDKFIEFNEGDVGLSGGIQVMENSSRYPTAQDRIIRVGGCISPCNPWPDANENECAQSRQQVYSRLEWQVKNMLDVMKAKDDKLEGRHKKPANSTGGGSMDDDLGSRGGGSMVSQSCTSAASVSGSMVSDGR